MADFLCQIWVVGDQEIVKDGTRLDLHTEYGKQHVIHIFCETFNWLTLKSGLAHPAFFRIIF